MRTLIARAPRARRVERSRHRQLHSARRGTLPTSGVAEAIALRERLADDEIDLGVALGAPAAPRRRSPSRSAGRDVPVIVLPELNEINFGRYEGGPLAAYREWAWTTAPDVDCPGGGESATPTADRDRAVLSTAALRGRSRRSSPSATRLPVRYIARRGRGPSPPARIGTIAHAEPHRLDARDGRAAAETLRRVGARAALRRRRRAELDRSTPACRADALDVMRSRFAFLSSLLVGLVAAVLAAVAVAPSARAGRRPRSLLAQAATSDRAGRQLPLRPVHAR